ncbi:hydantoinase/oxoprolinase family protein [Desulfoferrobacter suflitae]|uniref:hydantoinase/oxoprolinase family protein n=1 Tax=Desulfoferrobacter suflitae TaxID=2865782 RepID=UPI0021643A22|nr:hydantoinase/oxoprolinase family protein [Desulfoferrobacter suflitae]MCK8600301.1 hydantoinase/oxoprolinase family protein [Desulfoferrobacter suflitae]
MIIGLDVGGTHTDVVLIGQDCILRQVKVPTDPQNLLDCVWTGLAEVTRDVPPQDIRRAVLSTTLTTNAIAENKLVPTGMIVCSGPGVDPRCYKTNDYFYNVSGSIDHRGREVQSIDQMEIEAIASRLRSEGIRQVGVVGKFSVRNPQHEIQIRAMLGDDFDHVVLGHRLSGNLNFPRRIATTYLNAAVYPLHKKFFDAVKESLEKKGLHIPIYILKADGGTMSLEASLESPGQTILSGPAASVMGSLPFAAEDEETLVLDIGGTTTDMAILLRQVPLLDPLGIELGGFKTLIRALKTQSVPVGGDSVVRLLGERITIGPDRQGPAMAYGGPAPTPTDALFVLGKTSNGDVGAARRGLQELADKLGVGVEEMAARIFDEACFNILNEAAKMISTINSKPVYTVHELLEGYQVRPKEILVLGGPAPHFAFRLSRLTDFEVHVVPQWQVANAVGAALAKNTCEVTVFSDTERGIVLAPEENYSESVKRDYSKEAALELAFELLRKKCLAEGASQDEMEMEILEEMQFNMVRGFHTTGRNIRVKVQVKPGLIPEYKDIAQTLFNYCPLPS